MSRVFLFWLGQERESGSLIFLALFFQGSGLSFLFLVNVMSYKTSAILSTLSTGVSTATGCALILPDCPNREYITGFVGGVRFVLNCVYY